MIAWKRELLFIRPDFLRFFLEHKRDTQDSTFAKLSAKENTLELQKGHACLFHALQEAFLCSWFSNFFFNLC